MNVIKKLFCYVDETGQDTSGRLFIVAVVMTQNPTQLMPYLEQLEKETGKQRVKWGRAKQEQRLEYIKKITYKKEYSINFFYSNYQNTTEYKQSTILTIAKAINRIENFQNYSCVITIDALSHTDQKYYARQLRRLGIKTERVKGVKKDQNDAMIRLADSICGFVRDSNEGPNTNNETKVLYRRLMKEKCLTEV